MSGTRVVATGLTGATFECLKCGLAYDSFDGWRTIRRERLDA